MLRAKQLFLIVILSYPALCAGQPVTSKGMVRISGGSFQPLYAPAGQRTVIVAPFMIDSIAVSAGSPRKPVTNVTWKQASNYCRARGARLPTTIEWEYLARADERNRDAAATTSFKQRALELAIKAGSGVPLISDGLRNIWGVRGMHGSVVEWTQDFNGSAHAHNHEKHTATMTCASGTVETGDGSDYAAFLRYARRRTLNVNSSAADLGFRCAM